YLQTPVLYLLGDLSARFGEIKEGRHTAGFENAADFVNSCSEVWCIPQRVAAGNDVHGFGNDVKRSHILVGETDIRMSIAVTGDIQHRLGDIRSGDAATRVFSGKQKRDVAGAAGEINANRGLLRGKQ